MPDGEQGVVEEKNTHRLDLEGLDRLQVRRHVVRHGLEACEGLLRLVDDGLVLEDGTVVREVNGGGLRGELRGDALGIRMPLAEGLQARDGLCRVKRKSGRCEFGASRGSLPLPRPREE